MQQANTWKELDRHLGELLDMEESGRAPRLAELAADDPELARRLGRMLEGIARSAPLDNIATTPIFQEALQSLEGLAPGDRVGDWTLQRRAGQGGMAEVFEATRSVGGVEQRAAIKLMALGLGSEEQRRRFRQETGILARLDDHRLSRLIDAGTAQDGRPWLAMEYIEGLPIDLWCESRGLGVAERVGLVIEVARAVDNCHRALVVHRDLKPSNILVTPGGKPRLLDFGIAKVRDVEAADVQETSTKAPAFTLQFTSPEQLAGKVVGVDCDIYQLGLILYLLLTGQRAFARHESDPLALLQAMRKGPVLPSTACQSGVGENRNRRARAIRGDLDSVVMRALEPEPGKRYPGAREFADDLQRWLDGLPVDARTYTPWFRAARYLRRHWIGAGAVTAIALLLIGYAVMVTWQSERLTRERNIAERARLRAESIQDFLLQVFGSVDPESRKSRGKTVEQLLIEGAERARTEFVDQPLVAAQLLTDMALVLARRGKLEEARTAFSGALSLRENELGPEHPDTLAVMPGLGDVLYRLGEGEEARELLTGHLDAVERVFGAPSSEMVNALLALGPAESVYGDIGTAEALLKRAIGMHQSLYPDVRANEEEALRLAWLENSLSVILLRAKKYEEASDYQASSLAGFEEHAGRLDQRTLEARKNLGFMLRMLKRPDEALEVFEQTLRDERELYDGAHWQIAYTLGHMANLASDAKDYDRAIELWREAEEETRAAMGDDYYWVESARFGQARSMLLSGRLHEGRAILGEIATPGRDDAAARNAQAWLDRYTGE